MGPQKETSLDDLSTSKTPQDEANKMFDSEVQENLKKKLQDAQEENARLDAENADLEDSVNEWKDSATAFEQDAENLQQEILELGEAYETLQTEKDEQFQELEE